MDRLVILQADDLIDVEASKLTGLQTRNPENRQTMAGSLRDSAVPQLLTCVEGSFRMGKSATPWTHGAWSRDELPGPVPQRNR